MGGLLAVGVGKPYRGIPTATIRHGRSAVRPVQVEVARDHRPSSWERMFCEFTLNRDEFRRHYHHRNSVESTFRMIKGKFGDAVRSVADVAMKNKVVANEAVTEPPLEIPDYGYAAPELVANADPNTMDWDALFRADAETRCERYKRR